MAASPWQILVVALIILLLFGAGRLADIGKGLGEGIKNFKKGISDPEDGKAADKDPKQLPAKHDVTVDAEDSKSRKA